MTIIIAFILSHLSWFAIPIAALVAYIGGHVHGTAASATKVTAAQAAATTAIAATSAAHQVVSDLQAATVDRAATDAAVSKLTGAQAAQALLDEGFTK